MRRSGTKRGGGRDGVKERGYFEVWAEWVTDSHSASMTACWQASAAGRDSPAARGGSCWASMAGIDNTLNFITSSPAMMHTLVWCFFSSCLSASSCNFGLVTSSWLVDLLTEITLFCMVIYGMVVPMAEETGFTDHIHTAAISPWQLLRYCFNVTGLGKEYIHSEISVHILETFV